MLRRTALVSALLLVAVGTVWAQVPGSAIPPVPDRLGTQPPEVTAPLGTNAYGVANLTAAMTPPNAFQTFNYGLGYVFWADGYIATQSGDPWRNFDAPVYLPTGALIDSVKVFVYDNDASGYVRVRLFFSECGGVSACTTTTVLDVQSGVSETPGYVVLQSDGQTVEDMTWRNYDEDTFTADYGFFRVLFSTDSNDLRLGPVYFWYQRQISPAPAVATFLDVPVGAFGFKHVEALYASGITSGCGGGNFCPNQPLTRVQMAVFLAKALGLDYHDFTL